MALYSNYPTDSTRYMHIYSKHRNRILYPYSTDFEIPLPNKSRQTNSEENDGTKSVDPVYDGYPLEFGYFGSDSNDPSNYPYGLQLSNLSSTSSNFYSRLVVQDETVFPRDYATIVSYDSTVQTGYARSAIISGWVKGIGNTGNPGSLYSIRKSTPLVQGSCWVMPNPYQVNLVNTGAIAVNVPETRINLSSFESDYNTSIDYKATPVYVYPNMFVNVSMPSYGPTIVGVTNKNTGKMTNILASGYKNGNVVRWKGNTRFFVGDILYRVEGKVTHYYTVIKTGITGDVEPTSISANTVLDDPAVVVSSGVQYVYKGTTCPLRKKWFPLTHYDIGDILGLYSLTYVVSGTAGAGMTGGKDSASSVIAPPRNEVTHITFKCGDLTLYYMHWFSTDPGFGYLTRPLPKVQPANILQGFPITFNWAPNTYMAEGTFGIIPGVDTYLICVYKAGISGDVAPNFLPIASDFGIVMDGTAYVMKRGVIPLFRDYPEATLVSSYLMYPSTYTAYVGITYSHYYGNNKFQVTCVQEGTFGNVFGITTNTDGTVSFAGGTARFINHTTYSTDLKLIKTPSAPYTINPNPFVGNRYNVIPWSANAVFNTGEYMYYGVLTFNVIQGGISGNTPPNNVYKQTNGTIVISLLSYTDPYKGCLLKITQVEDNTDTFEPYYARISYYNPNTNIVHLDSALPITEKRCLYEILQYTNDNYNPLEYTVNPFFGNVNSPLIFYDVTLVSITLPNLPVYSANNINVMTSAQAQPFDSYPKLGSLPYVIVTLKNMNSLEQAIPICSNNVNEYSATFRVVVSDPNPNLTSLYTRLSGGETKTIRYNPNNSLRLTISDPQGNVLLFANPSFFEDFINFVNNGIDFPDTIRYISGNFSGFGLGWVMGSVLPIPPSSSNQVSATFAIKPHI